ncbi:DUF805 domain-containing protein [Magnetospirillum gryphiswaldense]|uniref:Inner membrane protein n=2 Tax=Magnetospirillum gryphiswaldense TaxID=55518 RepID=V6F3G5_MAGGM|nr:DUF805 domain-containing protein [Magnetospirillum gryphiswaldense]AVM74019.1 Inner membrane protein YhaH [Magnetospirillum gryphiswaldense MSR-1]AVM77922.1 Inner membrane protein YhaH [Magnetospirillum gryphiswaldense]CAM74623.1 conserved hypothetical protein, membrane [Magnetospirillum gryphiswaldense MSR-1]CDK98806.1 putative inner membrane protein [Magnetospirillum gryphiswaldense MSR-1 v2]
MKNLLLSLNGRIPRKTYWMFFLAIIVLNVVALTLDSLIAGDDIEAFPLFSLIISLAMIWPSIAVSAKRWHDRDKSGWWMLITLIPLVGPIWALVENGFLAGTEGDNRFGPACV